jgi:hypothetical protein
MWPVATQWCDLVGPPTSQPALEARGHDFDALFLLDTLSSRRHRIFLPYTPTIRLDFAGHGPTIPPLLARDAGIAQLVEHDLAKVGVASSSLVSRSKFYL